jgi:hypothetical protein
LAGDILAVQRNVEHRAFLGLQGQALLHQLGNARVVIAHGKPLGHVAGVEQGLTGMDGHRVHGESALNESTQ